MTSYEPVEAVLRGLNVLQAVSQLGSCTVNDVHARTAISRPTIVRMLETLIHAGYVYRPSPAVYALTARTLTLSAGYSANSVIAHHAPQVLAELQEAVGWPADVAVSQGAEMMTVATSPLAGRFSLNQPAGYRFSTLATSLGLAYLAFAPEEERLAALRNAADPSFSQVPFDPELAKRKLAAVRRRGYATIDPRASALNYGGVLRTLGVPVFGEGGFAIAAMNVIFLAEAVPMRTAIRKFVPALKAASARLSALIAESSR